MFINENIVETLLSLDSEYLAVKYMWGFHHYANYDFFKKCLAEEKAEFLK